mgnify:CR=1 FL=1
MGFEVAVCVGLQCRKEIRFVVKVEVAEDVLELNVASRYAALWPIQVFSIKPRLRFVMSRQKGPQCIDDSGFADIVGSNENV